MAEFLFANNATTTLAAGIGTSATTLQLATGTGALFPSPTTGEVFPVTLQDALTQTRIEICYCTHRSGDNLTVVRAQEGTAAQGYALGDLVSLFPTAGMYENFLQPPLPRTVLTTATTFYVDVNAGSNSNDGLTSGTAWQTINYALNTIASDYDLGGNAVTIQMANGTTYAPFHQTQEYSGGGSVTLQGNTGDSLLTAVAGVSGSPVGRVSAGALNVSCITVSGGTAGLQCDGGTLNADTISYGTCSLAHNVSSVFGNLSIQGSAAIVGAAPMFIQKLQGSVYIGDLNINFTASFNFGTALLVATEPGTIFAEGITYSGTSTGAYYLATYGGYVNTNKATAPSGFSGGSTGSSPNQGYFS